jgi:hypothetical protein
VSFLLLFEVLLVRRLLFLELFLELGVCFLEVLQVVLEQPSLSSPFLFQHVELPLQIAILSLLLGYALVQGSQFLVTTHNRSQLL